MMMLAIATSSRLVVGRNRLLSFARLSGAVHRRKTAQATSLACCHAWWRKSCA
jgi:hypothetical protein